MEKKKRHIIHIMGCSGCGAINTVNPVNTKPSKAHVPSAPPSGKNIVETAQATPDLSTLVAAVVAAGLAETLSNPDAQFTVYAPTNEAFNNLPSGVLAALLKPENKDTLVDILLYHVRDFVLSTESAGTFTTLNGSKVQQVVSGNRRLLIQDSTNQKAEVVKKVQTKNGVVYFIDKVLIPPNVDVGSLVVKPSGNGNGAAPYGSGKGFGRRRLFK